MKYCSSFQQEMGEVTSSSEREELTSTLVDVLLKAKDDFNIRKEFGIPALNAARQCLEKEYPDMRKTPTQVQCLLVLLSGELACWWQELLRSAEHSNFEGSAAAVSAAADCRLHARVTG